MNHPKIKHAISGENVGSNIPWSPAAELRLRHRITAHWFTMWIFFLMGASDVLAAFLPPKKAAPQMYLIVGVILFLCGVVNLYFLSVAREKLGEEMRRLRNGHWSPGSGILANKPRAAVNLTSYFEHREKDDWFICAGYNRVDHRMCLIKHFWKHAEWIPNHDPDQAADGTFPDIDPGGGRWVILCPCGVGHYKLRG